jgi:hypothetical protein
MPVLDGKVVGTRHVKQLNSAIATSNNDLILIQFRPSSVVDGVLSVETIRSVSSFPVLATPDYRHIGIQGGKSERANLLLLKDDAIRSQTKDIQTSIADQAKVGRGRNGKAIIDKRRVFNSVAVIARRAELHRGGDEGYLLRRDVLDCFYKKIGF